MNTTTEILAKKLEDTDGETFHAAMAALTAEQLRGLINMEGGGRYFAVNWADEYLPAAEKRDSAIRKAAEARYEASTKGKGYKGNKLYTLTTDTGRSVTTFRARHDSLAQDFATAFYGIGYRAVRGNKMGRR